MCADITKCPGIGCDKKERCLRFTVPSGHWQSYFQPDVVDCEYFIDKDNYEDKDKRKLPGTDNERDSTAT